ncbi:MAG TPA: hypothetical protein VLH81_06745 [Desulfobacterales bacterium]|nr:hypothetical protein [Desulfobacterales bacterium]
MSAKTSLIKRCRLAALAVVGLLLAAGPGWAGVVMDRVQARKLLRCGVSEGIPGFSVRSDGGRWTGMDADFCRSSSP